jgi:1,2-diacylglycerol 3-alpha-glucosyltransferase
MKDKKQVEKTSADNKKLKVALFIDSFFPKIDGVIVVVDNYAKILNKGNEVFVAAPGKKENFDDEKLGYPVHRCMQITKKAWSYTWPMPGYDVKFKRAIKAEKPDIIHIHSPFGLGKEGVRLAKKLNIPVVATIHSQFDQDFYKATKSEQITKLLIKRIMKIYNACDEVFVMNEKLKELLYGYGYKGKARLMLNATEMDYPKDPQRLLNIANERFNLAKNESVFLFVGRLIENKGILFLVEVMEELKKQNFRAKMLFIGAGPDEEKLKEEVLKRRLKNEVIIAGKIMDREVLASAYLRADLFLFPSKYDTDGLVRREAGAHKTPSLVAKDTMVSSLIKDNDTGFIAEYDVKKFAKRIMEIMSDKELLKQVGENTYSKEHITWDKSVSIALETYKEIIKTKNKTK